MKMRQNIDRLLLGDRIGSVDLDLFAGAGGLAIGLENAGFSPADLYEMDPTACATLRHNMTSSNPTLRGRVFQEDVSKTNWGGGPHRVRLLAAGAPCQPFSLAGKHLAEQDGRNLFPSVMSAVRKLRPEAVLLENVRGLLRNAFKPYFEYVLRQLEYPSLRPGSHELWQHHDERIRRLQCSAGYHPEYQVTWRLRDAADYGVPQTRQRVFIVATRADLPRYEFPLPTHSRAALIRSFASGEYLERHSLSKRKLRINGNGNFVLPFDDQDPCLPWRTVRDALSDLPGASLSEEKSEMNHWMIHGARQYAGHAGSVPDWPSKTIKAGVHGVPGGENTLVDDAGDIRYYTLREIARLQTFPDAHVFCGARIHVTRQIGNAVPCDLAAAIAQPLHELMTRRVHTEAREALI